MTIALIGITGYLGPAFLETFTDAKYNTQPVIVVTRNPSKFQSTSKVQYAPFSELDSVLERTDVAIALHAAYPELYTAVYKALAQSKVKLYFSASWGFIDRQVSEYLPGLLKYRADHIEAVRALGIKTVATFTGLFATEQGLLYDFALESIGFDVDTAVATYRGTGDEPFDVTFPIDIARSVAELIKKPVELQPDEFPIFSDSVTAREVVAQWAVRHPHILVTEKQIDLAEETARVAEKVSRGDFNFLADCLPVITGHGVDGGLSYSRSYRELVNPEQRLWTWGSYASRGTNGLATR